MTKEQITALKWAISKLPEDGHLVTLRQLFAQGEKAYNDRLIPLKDDLAKVPEQLLVFMAKHRLTIPNSELNTWRWLPLKEQLLGEINALPESRGFVRCTDGIMCYVERSDGTVYFGHFDFFVADPAVKINHDGTPKKEKRASVYENILGLYMTPNGLD